MTIEEALYARLAGYSDLTDLIGKDSGQIDPKIYPGFAAQDATRPYVVFRLIHGHPVTPLSGAETIRTDVWQISAIGTTYKEAKDIAQQIKAALHRFQGTMGGAGGVYVSECVKVGEFDAFAEDSGSFNCPTDFQIQHDAV